MTCRYSNPAFQFGGSLAAVMKSLQPQVDVAKNERFGLTVLSRASVDATQRIAQRASAWATEVLNCDRLGASVAITAEVFDWPKTSNDG